MVDVGIICKLVLVVYIAGAVMIDDHDGPSYINDENKFTNNTHNYHTIMTAPAI
jgi:hypothetical protein